MELKIFSVILICLNRADCPYEKGFSLQHFEAESIALCEKSVATLIGIDGLDYHDFKIICSVEDNI